MEGLLLQVKAKGQNHSEYAATFEEKLFRSVQSGLENAHIERKKEREEEKNQNG